MGEERYGGMFKLRFYRIVPDAKAKNGKRRLSAVSRLSYILFYSYPYLHSGSVWGANQRWLR